MRKWSCSRIIDPGCAGCLGCRDVRQGAERAAEARARARARARTANQPTSMSAGFVTPSASNRSCLSEQDSTEQGTLPKGKVPGGRSQVSGITTAAKSGGVSFAHNPHNKSQRHVVSWWHDGVRLMGLRRSWQVRGKGTSSQMSSTTAVAHCWPGRWLLASGGRSLGQSLSLAATLAPLAPLALLRATRSTPGFPGTVVIAHPESGRRGWSWWRRPVACQWPSWRSLRPWRSMAKRPPNQRQ